MKTPHALLLLLITSLAACVAPPGGGLETTEAATAEVVTRLSAGDRLGAETLYQDFGRYRGDDHALFAPLYEAARQRFEQGAPGTAADVLGLLAEQRPESASVREARVHALFVERARGGRSPEASAELEQAIADLREVAPGRPGWVDLAEAQAAIDRGDVPTARAAFETFRQAWTGYPEELAPYVQDIERYLEAHGSVGTR